MRPEPISKRIGIALLPCAADLSRIIDLCERTALVELWQDLLGRNENLPHLSILHANVADEGEFVECLFGTGPPSPAELSSAVAGIDYVERGRYFATISRTDGLSSLHQTVFERIKPLLLPGEVDDPTAFAGYSAREQSNFLKYGYKYLLEDFNPHITVGRTRTKAISPRHAELVTLLVDNLGRDLRFDEIAVCDLGPNGTLRSKITSRRL